MILSPREKNFAILCAVHWHIVTSFTISVLALWFSSVTAFQTRALRLGRHRYKCKFDLRIMQKFGIIRRVILSFRV